MKVRASSPIGPRPVVIDTDPGVDDALALTLALRSPALRVVLVTTVAGNVDIATATRNARVLMGLLAPQPMPELARGAGRPLARPLYTAHEVHGSDGLGGAAATIGMPPSVNAIRVRRDAAARIVAAARAHGRDLTLVALGPLTNLARAIALDRDAMAGVGRVVAMGGAVRDPGNVTPASEFNFYVDPEAAAHVVEAGLALTLVPLDVTRRVRLTRERFAASLSGRRDPLARALRALTSDLLRRYREDGMPLHDPLAVALAIDPGLAETEALPISIAQDRSLTAGMTVADLRPGREKVVGTPVDVAVRVDADRALDLICAQALGAPAEGRDAGRARRAPAVCVVGSANMDFVVATGRLPKPGETVDGADLRRIPGGKGANQAVACRRAGAIVHFAGRVGTDVTGDDLETALRREGIDTAALGRDPRPTGAALITVGADGQNLITVAPGANATLVPRHVEVLTSRLAASQVLVTQLESPLEAVEAALAAGRAAGLTTVLNPAPARALPARFAQLVDVLVPNETEAELLTGLPVRTVADARAAASALAAAGYPRVVVTLGQRGLVWVERSRGRRVHRVLGHRVEAVDATAAGDTFVGYLACGLAESRSFVDAVALANAAAALSVTVLGAQPAIPARAAVNRLLRAGRRSAGAHS